MSRNGEGGGPIVWAGILLVTCVLLLLFRHVLWLVLPFLCGLVLYYLLHAPVQRLVFSGINKNTAANIVAGAVAAVVLLWSVFALPWVLARAGQWQTTVQHYVEGGVRLLLATVAMLEQTSSLLRNAHLSQTLGHKISDFSETFASSYVGDFALGALAWMPSLLLAPLLAYFLLRDGGRFQRFLARAVPNAYFERTLNLLYSVDRTMRAYFQGLLKLAALDTLTLALGLWALGVSAPLALGLICAILAWVPFIGSVLGGLLVVMVAATDFPDQPWMSYGAVMLFVGARLLDDFVYMPITVGRSLRMHPLITVIMIFAGGAIAGVPGLMLVLPLMGVVMVIGETIGQVLTDPRLRARHAYARMLRERQAQLDLDR
ncbi:MAG: AI-2E family transporter [Rhodocyclaceae bacterium]|nr:AI-2E family transporter [Rhodocyclaceae bacterium]MBX3670294.1 AI-2E family transporter [Rhodocyclaceae bacterium]